MLTTDETFPASRLLTEDAEGTEMEGVEHLGQYVFEMTQAKVQMLKGGKNFLQPQEVGAGVVKYGEAYSEGGEDKVEVQVEGQVEDQVEDQVKDQVEDQVEEQVEDEMENEEMYGEGVEIEEPDRSQLDEIT